MKSFETFVDGVHGPLGEEPIRNVDHMGTIGHDTFFVVINPLEDVSFMPWGVLDSCV